MSKKILICELLFFGFLWSSSAFAQKVFSVHFQGANRTDTHWIESYLDVKFPADLTETDLLFIRQKLLNSALFHEVYLKIADGILIIDLSEKWTLIPVLRGQYGGGTPLRVFGAYEINSLGKGITLGGELRKYGNAPIGVVLYGKLPETSTVPNITWDLWQDNHLRTLYGPKFFPLNILLTKIRRLRTQFYWTLLPHLQLGGELQSSYLESLEQKSNDHTPVIFDSGIPLHLRHQFSLNMLPTLIFDHINLEGLFLEGSRLTLKTGLSKSSQNTQLYPLTEFRVFYYKRFSLDFNLATHFFLGANQSPFIGNEYFLGGFDSIRGIPDGALWGTNVTYTNIELRQHLSRFEFLTIQKALFLDYGFAANSFASLLAHKNSIASFGAGLRFAIPQIHRFVVRIDYAWSVGPTRFSGFSIGLNNLFEPNPPLSL